LRIYPDDKELEEIKNWPLEDPHGLMAYVKERWEYADTGCWRDWKSRKNDKHVYRLATGGWSGNESIIGALRENYFFWGRNWELSARGGLHIFKIT